MKLTFIGHCDGSANDNVYLLSWVIEGVNSMLFLRLTKLKVKVKFD